MWFDTTAIPLYRVIYAGNSVPVGEKLMADLEFDLDDIRGTCGVYFPKNHLVKFVPCDGEHGQYIYGVVCQLTDNIPELEHEDLNGKVIFSYHTIHAINGYIMQWPSNFQSPTVVRTPYSPLDTIISLEAFWQVMMSLSAPVSASALLVELDFLRSEMRGMLELWKNLPGRSLEKENCHQSTSAW